MRKKLKKLKLNKQQFIIAMLIIVLVGLLSYISAYVIQNSTSTNYSMGNIPEYSNEKFVNLNNNMPYFNENDRVTSPFEKYSELDKFNRCGVAYANICKEIMPSENEERESISAVTPTGWEQTKINGEYLYNRCHLIGYQLAGENANEKNLITGTRYFNVEGMLPFENEVDDYLEKNGSNHVLYRVTPNFQGNNLLASGVEIEAYSVEDGGKRSLLQCLCLQRSAGCNDRLCNRQGCRDTLTFTKSTTN